MQDPFIGEIMLFAGKFPPRGWADCNGQLLPISPNQALFALIGTIYGGNGTTNFALPDLRGAVPMGQGQAPGRQNYVQGLAGGTETVTLTTPQLPAHTHTPTVKVGTTATAPVTGTITLKVSTNSPGILGATPSLLANGEMYTTNISNPVALNATSISPNLTADITPVINNALAIGSTGAGQSVPNMQPYLPIRYCIALVGIFPTQD